MDLSKKYVEYLEKLKKEELGSIIERYHTFCKIYGQDVKNYIIKGKKKNELIDYLNEHHEKYIEYIMISLDIDDYNILKEIIKKNSTIGIEKKFIAYLHDIHVLFSNEIANDTLRIIRKYLKDKSIIKKVKLNTKKYFLGDGIIVAYGVIDKEKYKTLIGNKNDFLLISNYYKKSFIIDSKKIVSTKLSNKKKINKYYKDKNYKDYSRDDFIELGKIKYHHRIKSYKRLIKILKKNYVFKNEDIVFVDNNIIIPYLYNSLADEDLAQGKLELVICDYFEFNNHKLKDLMLKNIIKIKEDFPVWEYRGKTKNEVSRNE